MFVKLDVTSESSWREAVANVEQRFGPSPYSSTMPPTWPLARSRPCR
jgi:hypothetical protein